MMNGFALNMEAKRRRVRNTIAVRRRTEPLATADKETHAYAYIPRNDDDVGD